MSSQPMIRTENLTRDYLLGQNVVHALRGVSFSIDPGEFVALMGASGCGKSTLLSLLGCLDQPTGGSYWLEGRDTRRFSSFELARVRGTRIGMVFQNFYLIPGQSALENVLLPLLYQPDSRAAESRAREALERVGLAERASHRPNQLSGGERQRVAIARALVSRPAILLADEPTGNLDSATGQEILSILRTLWQSGLTLLLVTHDPQIAASAERVIRLKDGQIVHEEHPGGFSHEPA